MKVYTRTGDSGMTSIVGGQRLPKSDPRIDAYGTIDELNSWLGLLIASPQCPPESRALMIDLQSRLFDIGGHLAGVPSPGITPENIAALEADIDRMTALLPPITQFILPGGTIPAAQANIARTVCRRAERLMVLTANHIDLDPAALTLINRLSDWLFTFARFLNLKEGKQEFFWKKQ